MKKKSNRETVEYLQYLNYGFAGVIRFNEERNIGVLNQSVAEHTFGMMNIIDVVRDEIDGKHDVDWDKVVKMARYHDVGEIETGDVVESIKSEIHRDIERAAIEKILQQFPQELGNEVGDLLIELEIQESIESRIVHAIDKIEAQITIATETGVEELRDLHRRLGANLPQHARQKMSALLNLLVEWELDILVELLEEVWQMQIELGILDEDPQLAIEFEKAVEDR